MGRFPLFCLQVFFDQQQADLVFRHKQFYRK